MPPVPDPNLSTPEFSRSRFSAAAQAYVKSTGHASGTDLERLLILAAPQPDWKALDIATGGGHTALKLAPYVHRVTACDLTPAMLQAASAHLAGAGVQNADFCLAEAGHLPFAASGYDLVTCRIAAHHFPDVPCFLSAAARVLRPGGVFVLQDHVLPDDPEAARYVDDFERTRDPSHNRAYCQDDWSALSMGAGLQVEQAEIHVKRHNLHTWAERQGCSPETLILLETLLAAAPPAAAEWLAQQDAGTPQASFANHHLLLRAVKPDPQSAGSLGGTRAHPVVRRMV